ncbi:hypothetical protein DVH05_002794 [Phytophthora capsici]|nr:hypothetical protein DVH05_002794 [Phytophthora capsici]
MRTCNGSTRRPTRRNNKQRCMGSWIRTWSLRQDVLASSMPGAFLEFASYDMTAVLLLASGFMLGGPANLISTAISADLGTHVGVALVQFLVGYLKNCQYEPNGATHKALVVCRLFKGPSVRSANVARWRAIADK